MHACCRWVQAVGEANPDIYYTDRAGVRNRECLSLGCDRVPLFEGGKTPLDVYKGFVEAFADTFQDMFGAHARLLPSRNRTRYSQPADM